MKDILTWSLRRAREQTLQLVAGIPPDRSCEQRVPGEHHPVWTLGHLILGDAYLMTLLGAAPLPADFERLLAHFGPGAAVVSDSTHYDALGVLHRRLADLGVQRQEVLAAASDAALAQPLRDAMLARAQPTLGHHLQALACHEGYHAGALTAWRQAHGFPPGRWIWATPSA